MSEVALVHRWLADDVRGGVSRLYSSLASELRHLGIDVTTVSSFACHAGSDHVTIPLRLSDRDYRDRVSDVLRQRGTSVAECSSWEFELGALAAQPAATRPATLVRCEFAAREIGADRLEAGEAGLIRDADRRIAVSRYAANSIRTTYGVDVDDVILNGVARPASSMAVSPSLASIARHHRVDVAGRDTTALLPAATGRPPEWIDRPATRPRLLWIGKVTEMKGWAAFEQLVRMLGDRAEHIVVIGHSPVLSPLTIGSESNVMFLQDVPEAAMATLRQNADYLLSTSTVEGFGLVMAEAILAGCPVLAPSALAAASEFVVPGVDGFLYDSLEQAGQRILDGDRPEGRMGTRIPSVRAMTRSSLAAYDGAERTRALRAATAGGVTL